MAATSTAASNKPPCKAPNCDRPSHVKGMCYAHYRRQIRGGDISTPVGVQGLVDITGTRVAEEVKALVMSVAKAEGITDYEQVRNIFNDWYFRVTGKRARGDARPAA